MVSIEFVRDECSPQLPIGIFSIRDLSRNYPTHSERYYSSKVPGCRCSARFTAVDILRSQLLLCAGERRSKQQPRSL